MGKVIALPRKRRLRIDTKKNSVIVGDCLEWLKFVPSGSIDVCYIDPPFFSNRNYEVIWGNGYELRSFGDRWKGGVKSYIVWMEERVKEIHRVLKDTGSIFLHCDWHASHRLRVMLDDVFGEENFINEIIWCYSGGGASKKWFSKKHDTIFFYSKSKKYRFNVLKELRTEKSLKRLQNPNGARIDKTKNEDWDKRNIVDYWVDIQILNPVSKERIGYRTQKPEALLERILKCSTKENDLILDCFGGGGTTATVAAKLGRRFITGDVSPVAVKVIAERLNTLLPPPQYSVLNVPKTKEEWLLMNGIDFEKRICAFMGWEWSGKGVNDNGIDGWAKNKTVPIQIKNYRNRVGRPDIQKFVGALGKRKEGIFVAWDFTPTAWDYTVEAKKEYGKVVQFIKVEDILGDILIDSDKKMEIENLYREKAA